MVYSLIPSAQKYARGILFPLNDKLDFKKELCLQKQAFIEYLINK